MVIEGWFFCWVVSAKARVTVYDGNGCNYLVTCQVLRYTRSLRGSQRQGGIKPGHSRFMVFNILCTGRSVE